MAREATVEGCVELERNPRHQIAREVTTLRQVAREDLEEKDTEPVDVGALVGGLASEHLRRDVREGARDLRPPRGVERDRRTDLRCLAGFRGSILDVSEVGEARPFTIATGLDEHVRRLHVAVHEAAPVGVAEGSRDIAEQRQGSRPRQRPAEADELGERRAVDMLEHHVGRVVRQRDFEGPYDGRVGEGRLDLRGASKRRQSAGVVGDLDRHDAPEQLVLGPEDLAEPAATDQGDDPVVEDPVSWSDSADRREMPRILVG